MCLVFPFGARMTHIVLRDCQWRLNLELKCLCSALLTQSHYLELLLDRQR